jgi:hypothetical protein
MAYVQVTESIGGMLKLSLSESGGYRATCTELVEVSRDNVQDLRIYRIVIDELSVNIEIL